MSIRFNFPSAKNATDRLSGDQNGRLASSVPSSINGSKEFMRRSQSARRPVAASLATNAITVPSGEMEGGPVRRSVSATHPAGTRM